MKKLTIFSLVLMFSSLLIFSVGCQEESTLAGPENISVSDQNQLDKKDKSTEKQYSASKLITVEDGGKIVFQDAISLWQPALYIGAEYVTGNLAMGLRYDLLYEKTNVIYSSALSPVFRVYF